MRIYFILVPAALFVIYIVRTIALSSLKSQCDRTTKGSFISSDASVEVDGRFGHAVYFPIYEYVVNGIAYWAKIESPGPNPVSFATEVEVRYNHANPEMCFVGECRGNIISQYNKEEYDRGGNGDNVSSDYKWRP